MQYALSERDVNELRALLALTRGQRYNPTLRPSYVNVEDEEHQGPEVYVAKTPPGGIPGLIPGIQGGTPTGTGDAGNEDRPGVAQCYIYSVAEELDMTGTGTTWRTPGIGGGPGTGTIAPTRAQLAVQELSSLRGPSRLVYNFTTQTVPGGVWILIQRDKAGKWWVVQSGGGGGGRQLVELYKKTYTTNQWTRYDWKYLADTMPFGFSIDGVGPIPAYHIDDQIPPGVDLPVPFNAYVNQSAISGAYLLIEALPEWDFGRKTGAQSAGYFPGYRVRYRQDTGLIKDMYQILIIDINAVGQDPADPP